MREDRSRRSTDTLGSARAAFERIRVDRQHGARALATDALATLAELANSWSSKTDAELRATFLGLAQTLERSQPAMGPFLRWAEEWRDIARTRPRGSLVRAARSWIRRERSRARTELPRLTRTSRRRFPNARHVVTLSRSESVLGALLAPRRRDRPSRVSVLESLPGGEGRIFANELRREGLSARVIPDRRGARTVGKADLLIIGADAVFSDGSVVHKVGTKELARVASISGVPVVVVAGLSKFTGRPPPHRALPSRFDRTPSRYITEFWTDRGVRIGGSRRRLGPRHIPL